MRLRGSIAAVTLVLGLAPSGGSAPVVTSVQPNLGQGATHALVVVVGFNFAPGAILSFPATGITVSQTVTVSKMELHARVTVAPDASPGLYGATVTNPNGLSGTCEACFTVDPGPKPTQAIPSSAARGASLVVRILGSGFQDPSAVRFGSGITVTSVTFVGATELDASVAISANARVGSRTISVRSATDFGAGSCAGCFTVTT